MMLGNCIRCGIELIDDNWYSSHKKKKYYICKKCQSKYMKSRRIRNDRKNMTQTHKDNISKALLGKPKPKEFIFKYFSGKNNPNWKGGISTLLQKIRLSDKYSEWRKSIYIRDNFTCQICKKRCGKVEAHHIRRFSHIIEDNNIKTFEAAMGCAEIWDISNGITLCKGCHNTFSKREL